MSDFILHPRLAADTSFVADWPLCRVLLMEDSRYFWLILVPRIILAPSALRIAGDATGVRDADATDPTVSADAHGGGGPVTEITQLSSADRAQLMEEAARAGRVIAPAKLNIGALGNLVPQLHLHVVGRSPGDPAWPGPVWGHSVGVPYDSAARAARIALVSSH